MADRKPELAGEPRTWYQGLSRYQWWVLIIATMGWMFNTMDQQFFNMGRGAAMLEVLNYDPISLGLRKLGTPTQRRYTAADLDRLVAEKRLTVGQKAELLAGDGRSRTEVTRKEVAAILGHELLIPTYVELGEHRLAQADPDTRAYTRGQLQRLVEANVFSIEAMERYLGGHPDGVVPRDVLAAGLGREIALAKAHQAGDDATMIFVIGWAIGGLFFGWIGDSIGRVKTMAITILVYALFTGLNGLAQTEWQFNVLRFLTALGVGGEFAAGAALVAESMPDRSRPAALGTLQAVSAVGNMMAAVLAALILPALGWRWLFAAGGLPVLVVVLVMLKLREPEKWRQARARWLAERAQGIRTRHASYVGLLGDRKWRMRAILGLLLGVVGVGGLWGVAFFTPELNSLIAKHYSPEKRDEFVVYAFFLQQFGGFLGISAYTVLSLRMGRRPAFAVFFLLAFVVVSYTFLFADTIVEAYVLAPLVGFVTLGPFGGYAIYFPELFPTRLRTTGVGFCYNVGRFLAALVPKFKSGLKGLFLSGAITIPLLPSALNDAERAIRYGSFIMIFIYLVGLVVLLFAPETKDRPLPED